MISLTLRFLISSSRSSLMLSWKMPILDRVAKTSPMRFGSNGHKIKLVRVHINKKLYLKTQLKSWNPRMISSWKSDSPLLRFSLSPTLHTSQRIHVHPSAVIDRFQLLMQLIIPILLTNRHHPSLLINWNHNRDSYCNKCLLLKLVLRAYQSGLSVSWKSSSI